MTLSSQTRRKRRNTGFTLLEILVVSAIAAILVVTAASLLVTMSAQRAANRKRLDRLTQSFTAMTLLERSLLNGGYHFPSARFGFRVYDNVAAGGTYAGFTVGGSACNGALGCIVPNTDVLELVEGLTPQPGQLSGTSADGGFIINVPGGPLFYDAGSEQHLFLFGSNDGGTCLYKGALVADTQVAASPVDRDLTIKPTNYYTVGQAPANYQCPPSTTGANDWTVSVAGIRHVYMVLYSDGGTRGLYQATISPLQTALSGAADGGLLVLARGVDNFQVVPLVSQGGTAFVSGCRDAVCDCNVTGADCSMTGAANSATDFVNTSKVVGVRVAISARGDTDDRTTGAAVVPPRLANETMPADTLKRTTQTQTYMLRNFAQVQP